MSGDTCGSTVSIKYIDNFSLGKEYDHLFKCLLLGDSATGKSSLCDRQVERHFNFNHQSIPTCGVDFKVQAFEWEGKVVKLQIWDTAGQERFRAIVNSYYRNSSGILLCYDITDPTTAENIRSWLVEIEKYAPVDVPVVLCGTKRDLRMDPYQTENTRLSGEIIADILKSYPEIKHQCETSAKTGAGVEDAFLKLVDVMLKQEAWAKREQEAKNLDKCRGNRSGTGPGGVVQSSSSISSSSSSTWGKGWDTACSLVKKPFSSLMAGTGACGT